MKSARIRPFASDDVDQVARLHHSLYRCSEEYSRDVDLAYASFFHDVYLGNPWYEEQLSSLVYEEADGKITGFLGVMPRSMRIDGRPVRAAVSSMFMVACCIAYWRERFYRTAFAAEFSYDPPLPGTVRYG